MDETSYSSTTSKLWMNPFKDETNITALKKIEELISASIGPHGKLICIGHVSGGSATITSSSQRLFSLISIQNILLKLIVSSAKLHLNSFNNDGLCCALLILKLIKNSLYVDYPLPVIGKLVEYFGNLFIEHLNMDKNACVQKIDLSNLTYIQSIVLSILASKPGSVLREEDKQYLCILLIKVFLNCVPSSSSDNNYRNINLITLESVCCDQSNLYEGLLVRLPEFSQKIHSQLYSNSSIKVVLYTSSLAGDADFPVDKIEVTDDVNVWETVLNEMKSAVEKLIRTGIHILACQKVVHPSLRKLLEDSNILVLDRLGFEVAKHLEYILGTSNTSLFEEPSFGYLTSIHQITIGKKSFLLLSKEAKSFWTMLICNFNEQAVNETKVVCQQAIDTLIHLLKKHFVCYGAGCTEIHTIKLVVQKIAVNGLDVYEFTAGK